MRDVRLVESVTSILLYWMAALNPLRSNTEGLELGVPT